MAYVIRSITKDGRQIKKAFKVESDKAQRIKQTLQDMPGNLSEEQYDYLKSIDHIRFGDGSRFPELPGTPRYEEKLTNIGVLQGMNEIIPRGDR